MPVTNRDVLRIFWEHARRYKGRLFIICATIFIGVLVDVFFPWYLKDFIDALTSGSPSAEMFPTVRNILLVMLLLRGIAWLAWRVEGFLSTDFQPRVMTALERTSFSYLLGHSFKFFADTFAGSLVRKVSRLSRAFEKIVDEFQFRFLPVTIILIGTTIGLLLRFPTLALIFIIWALVFIYINYRASLWKLKIDVLRAEADSRVTGVLADALANIITIKLFTGARREEKHFGDTLEDWRMLQTKGWRRGEIIFACQALLLVAVEIGLLWYGAILWSRGILTAGDLVLIQSYMVVVIHKLWDVGRSFRHVFEAFADAKEMVEILQLPYGVKDRRGAKELHVKQGKVDFKSVSFGYTSKHKVLDRFSLSIAPREKVALVGVSGAGKSTIAKLLMRFDDIQSGSILIDNQDIDKATQESLRRAIAVVPQEPILFHRSLMENIRYGEPEATDEEVIIAAKKAHCHEFISRLPLQYGTYVGERGVKLSGGERQRVAIARAILKRASILVLDEATSSLDSESERLIQDALHELMRERTTIVIAHRLSTIMQMDRIIVMEEGRVVATGTHDDLYKDGGIYQKLWDIQAGGFIK